MKKEKGFSPIFLFVVIILIMIVGSLIVAGFQMVVCVTCGTAEKIPVIGWLVGGVSDSIKKAIPLGLAGIIDAIIGMADWSLQRKFLADDVTVTSLAQQTGWTTVRDLANMVMVLGLIIIAICIILGIREFEAKRTLPIFILIALLINFTPVICGFFIDLSDKITAWMARGGISTTYAEKVEDEINNNPEKYCDFFTIFLFTLFMLVAAIVYFMYFILFIIRFVYLLLLVIVSPLAFASRIFPSSDKIRHFFPKFLHWDGWWNEFLTWCTIGFFGAFFLMQANTLFRLHITGSSITGDAGILGDIILYFLPILFLLIGFFLALQTAQAVAAVAMLAGGALMAGMALKSFGKKMALRSSAKKKKLEQKMARGESLSTKEKAELALAKVGEAPAVFYYGIRKRIPFMKKETWGDVEKAHRMETRKELEGKSMENLAETYKDKTQSETRRQEAALHLMKRGRKGIEKLKGAGATDEEIASYMQMAASEGRWEDAQWFGTFLIEKHKGKIEEVNKYFEGIFDKEDKEKIAARLSTQEGKEGERLRKLEEHYNNKEIGEEEYKKKKEEIVNEYLKEHASEEFLGILSPEILASGITITTAQQKELAEALAKIDSPLHVQALASQFGTAFTHNLQQYLEEHVDEVGKNLNTYLRSTPAQALGLRLPQKLQELEASIDMRLERAIEEKENALQALVVTKRELSSIQDPARKRELQAKIKELEKTYGTEEEIQKQIKALTATRVNLHKMSGRELIDLGKLHGVEIELPKEEEEKVTIKGGEETKRQPSSTSFTPTPPVSPPPSSEERTPPPTKPAPRPTTTQRIKEIEKEIKELERVKSQIKRLQDEKEAVLRAPHISPEDKKKRKMKLDAQISKILKPTGIEKPEDLEGKIKEMEEKRQKLIEREIEIRNKIKEMKDLSSLDIQKEIDKIEKELSETSEREIEKRERLKELKERLKELKERKERVERQA